MKNYKRIVELRQESHEELEKAKAIHGKSVTEKRALTGDEQRQYDDIMKKVDSMNEEARNLEKEEAEAAKEEMRLAGRNGVADDTTVLRKEQRMADLVKPTHEERQLSIGKFVKGIVTGDWTNAASEQRAMSEGVLTGGGYMVPEILSANIIDKARNQARVIQAGAGIVPMTSNKLTIAKVTGDPTASWKAENAHGTFSDMTFDAINFEARTLMALVKVSVELLEDAQNIDTVIYNALSQALALEVDRVALYGSGVGVEPLGLKNAAGIQTISMGANGAVLTGYDKFSEAVQAIREQNGEPNSVIYAPRTAGQIDRLKDSTGQPLTPLESFKALGKFSTKQVPTNLTQGTNTLASDAFVGDFSQLLIGMRKQFSLEVSRQAADGPDSAFTQHQVWIKAVLRADVQVARPEHFDVIKGITIT